MKIRNKYRTHTCGELRAGDAAKTVTLCGFYVKGAGTDGFDLRDRHGVTRITLGPNAAAPLRKRATETDPEDVVQVVGEVAHRVEPDPLVPTGDIHVNAKTITILSHAEPLPPDIGPGSDPLLSDPEERLRFRYLDLRRPAMQRRLAFRSKLLLEVRNYFAGLDFLEVETPYLARFDAEQAAAFLVPARAGESFALPQSPQVYKQLLMVAGVDRYFQVVRCFRNERGRLTPDRQPEFTALDLEMAYIDEEDVYPVVDGLMAQIWKSVLNKSLGAVRKLTHEQAMLRYGTDRPDLRFALEIEDLTDAGKRWPIPEIQEQLDAPEPGVRSIRVPAENAEFEKGFLEGLPIEMRRYGDAFVTTVRVGPNGSLFGRIADALDAQVQKDISAASAAKQGDVVVLIAARHKVAAATVAGQARLAIGRKQRMIDRDRHELVWVHQFPFWEYDPIAGGWTGGRHPFTQPLDEDLPRLEADKYGVRTKAYDLVLNGVELGAGSIRVTDADLQARIFDMFEYAQDEVLRRFGFIMDAFRFGVPPHGGLVIGLDRLIGQLLGFDAMDEVIPFPKNRDGRDVMMDAPSSIDPGFVRAMLLP